MAGSRAYKRAAAGTHIGVVCSLPALLFVLFTLMSPSCSAQYALNDPRNPDCPCHKYQKMADDAYKQQQTDQTKNTVQNALQVNATDNTGNDLGSHSIHQQNNAASEKVKISTGFSGTRVKKKKP